MRNLLTILFLFLFTTGFGNTIEVGRDRVVTSLRKAVDLAQDGDTILLHKGIYKEGNILIDKKIIFLIDDAQIEMVMKKH